VHILRHFLYNKTKLRACTVRILLIVPVFSVVSWLVLALRVDAGHYKILLVCFRDVWEAVVLASFLQFVLTVLGGPKRLAERLLAEKDEPVKHIGLCSCLPTIEPGAQFVVVVMAGMTQYIAVMAMYAILNVLLWCFSAPDAWFRYLDVVKGVGCGVAMYFLTLFAHEVYHGLPNIGLVKKFVAIKGIVFFTVWQMLLLELLHRWGFLGDRVAYLLDLHSDGPKQDRTTAVEGLNNLFLCFESLAFCIMHYRAYPAREWVRLLEAVEEKREFEDRRLWKRIESNSPQ
ncbi:unnamed protein product, partial [Effrenium voratum]